MADGVAAHCRRVSVVRERVLTGSAARDGAGARSPAPRPVTFAQALPSTWFPWLVASWLAGVCICAIRFAGGWWQTRRLVREDSFDADEAWVGAVDRLSTRLRLAHTRTAAGVGADPGAGGDRVLEAGAAASRCSDDGALPAADRSRAGARARTHPPARLPCQPRCSRSSRPLLFYHPGVWWVSHTIRVEREHCCDDLAVSVCGDALLYARALTNIETLRHERIGIAMAASNGSLLSRVRRLLGVRPPARLAASGWVVLSLTAILVASAGVAGWIRGAVSMLPASIRSRRSCRRSRPASVWARAAGGDSTAAARGRHPVCA